MSRTNVNASRQPPRRQRHRFARLNHRLHRTPFIIRLSLFQFARTVRHALHDLTDMRKVFVIVGAGLTSSGENILTLRDNTVTRSASHGVDVG